MSTESQLDTQILIRQGDISLENCQYSSVVVRLELGREDASPVEWFRKSAYVSSSPWEDSRGQDMLKWGYSGCFHKSTRYVASMLKARERLPFAPLVDSRNNTAYRSH